MTQLSDHTKLMNACIAFSKDIREWPQPLKDAGYQLEKIEASFLNSEEGRVNPDLLFSSNSELHVLITECKGGSISQERVDKYNKINPGNLRREVSHVYDVERISNETWVVGTEKTKESFDHLGLPEAGLIFGESECYRINEFDDEKLNNTMTKEEFPKRIPVSLYPFPVHDDKAIIAGRVAQHMMHLATQGRGDESKFTASEILQEIHDHWEDIGESEQNELVRKVENILDLFEREEVRGDLRKIEGSREYYVRTSQALQDKVNEIIEDLGNNENLDDYNI